MSLLSLDRESTVKYTNSYAYVPIKNIPDMDSIKIKISLNSRWNFKGGHGA